MGTQRCDTPNCGDGFCQGGHMGVDETRLVDGSRNAPEHSSEDRVGQPAQRGVPGGCPWYHGERREGGGEEEAGGGEEESGGGEGDAAGSVGECVEVGATEADARSSRHACKAR